MLYREMIADYSGIHSKIIREFFDQEVGFINVKPLGI
jgi:hypothetical protein